MAQSFQRARTGAQREERRASILESAMEMLAEMPVAATSFSELSKRVGLARSNLMRYFESREAVLLEILDQKSGVFLERAAPALDAGVSAGWPAQQRIETCAHILAAAFAEDPVLCDLLSQQAAVLEHNVSREAAIHYKRAVLAHIGGLAEILRAHIPEFGRDAAFQAASLLITLVGAIWTHTHPAPAMLDAFEHVPELDTLEDFVTELQTSFAVTLSGTLSRSSQA